MSVIRPLQLLSQESIEVKKCHSMTVAAPHPILLFTPRAHGSFVILFLGHKETDNADASFKSYFNNNKKSDVKSNIYKI